MTNCFKRLNKKLNFTYSEFIGNSDTFGIDNIDRALFEKFITKLQTARTIAKTRFIITSWYRSPEYNKKVGGVADSAHVAGIAVDIAFTDSHQKFLIVSSLFICGFKRIGISDKNNFVHVDLDLDKPQNVLFTY